MTLYDYIKESPDWEVTVWDDVYDIEVYFYKPDDYNNLDLWDTSIIRKYPRRIYVEICKRFKI